MAASSHVQLRGILELSAHSTVRQTQPKVATAASESQTQEVPNSVSTNPWQAIDTALRDAEQRKFAPETVIQAIRDIRVGQERFRAALLRYWDGSCAVTGLRVARLLRASHCKP